MEYVDQKRGVFLSFEGSEGSGKSTQMRILAERLRSLGRCVVENQEPGGTEIGKQIRRILLDPENSGMDATAELLLMFASRAQAAAEVIRPALERGDVVLSDRFTDSSLAYQGHARGLGGEAVLAAHRLAVGSLEPDLTIWVDVDLKTGLQRAHRRNSEAGRDGLETRMDEQSLEFHRRVVDGYSAIAESDPERFRKVDGSGRPEEVAGRVWDAVAALFGER